MFFLLDPHDLTYSIFLFFLIYFIILFIKFPIFISFQTQIINIDTEILTTCHPYILFLILLQSHQRPQKVQLTHPSHIVLIALILYTIHFTYELFHFLFNLLNIQQTLYLFFILNFSEHPMILFQTPQLF